MITLRELPSLNAILNLISASLLLWGRVEIKKSRTIRHRAIMIAALVSSSLFLTSYLIYHQAVGSVPYPKFDWTRPVYFSILAPHIILAGLMTPFIILAVWFAFRGRFDKHKKVVRVIWPVWMFVSLSGIAVYLMLYRF